MQRQPHLTSTIPYSTLNQVISRQEKGENTLKLINGFDLMRFAEEKNYVLPAFNTTNMEITYAIVKGLSEANLPGYVQVSSSNLRLSNPEIIATLTRDAARNVEVPIGLHLDHGKSFEDVKACIDAGFTSIMMDASHLPYDENIKETKMVADYCHSYGLPVEAELGALKGKEDDIVSDTESKTDPDMVFDFVKRTNCDTLAVSVGNVHGLSLNPQIDLPLLKKIHDASPVPLVLHGGSGIQADVIKQAKSLGLIKINYGSALRHAFISTFGKAYELNHNEYDVIKYSFEAVENISSVAKNIAVMINS